MLEGNKKYNNKPTTKEELEPTSKKKEQQPTNFKAYEGTSIKKSCQILRNGNTNEAKSYQIQTIQTATRLILSNLGFLKWWFVKIGDSSSN